MNFLKTSTITSLLASVSINLFATAALGVQAVGIPDSQQYRNTFSTCAELGGSWVRVVPAITAVSALRRTFTYDFTGKTRIRDAIKIIVKPINDDQDSFGVLRTHDTVRVESIYVNGVLRALPMLQTVSQGWRTDKEGYLFDFVQNIKLLTQVEVVVNDTFSLNDLDDVAIWVCQGKGNIMPAAKSND